MGCVFLMKKEIETRIYRREKCAVFRKTKEKFGGLSNMAGGYPIVVKLPSNNTVEIRTSEALYQACRFPNHPDVQKLIINQASPMTAKMESKPYRKDSRPDWDNVRIRIMRWCLRVKLVCNWDTFSELLLDTGDRPIVEDSHKDSFWGAKPSSNGDALVGKNVLGRLLMELREEVRQKGDSAFQKVEAPNIKNFLLFGEQIVEVRAADAARDENAAKESEAKEETETVEQPAQQSTEEPKQRKLF